MTFDQLDQKMRVFETAHDDRVLPAVFMVARLDGRSFTRLTKDRHRFEAPFDIRFRDLMLTTLEHLMSACSFRIAYGYTQSDEISLLMHREEASFGRKLRKLNSILAGEASVSFSMHLGDRGCFDCRICELPTEQLVVDYFRWRSEDALRNALNAHCYWLLRQRGESATKATGLLRDLTASEKKEFLSRNGTEFDHLPAWQKRGVGMWWKQIRTSGVDPRTGREVEATRRRLWREFELPIRGSYDTLVRDRLIQAS